MSIASSFDFNMIWSIFGLFIQIVVFGFCVYYVFQKQSSDAFLLAGGSFIHLLTSLVYAVGIPILSGMNMELYSNRNIFAIIGFIGLIGSLCFSAGLVLLIVKHLKLNKLNNPDQ
jgi:hypothetical protein